MPGRRIPRRRAALGALGGLLLTRAATAGDAPGDDALAAAIRSAIGDRVPADTGMTLRLPTVAENGGQVPVTVSVDSPMTPADHVVAIHLFATGNPTPDITSFRLSPAIGRAEVQTRIRLATAQLVVAIADMSDGSVRRATARADVTQGGCLT